MASEGWILKDETARLVRLSSTQMERARLLEARVISARQQMDELEQTIGGTVAALDRAGGAGLMFYAAAMRRLADLNRTRELRRKALDDLTRKLVKAKISQDVLERRVGAVRLVEERKLLEDETRESALLLKASGKHIVMK